MILFSTVTFVLSLVCSGRLRNLPSNKKYVYTYNKNICLTYLVHIVANLQVLMSCTYNTLSGIFRLPELRKGSWEPYGESLYPSLIPPFPPPPPPPPLPSPCKYWIWSWYEREGTAILFYTIVHVLCTVINRHLARLIILYIVHWHMDLEGHEKSYRMYSKHN